MDLHERLVAARKHAGFAKAADAAATFDDIPYATYAGHENGSSGFRANKGEIYAKKFKVRFEWLMRGTGPMVDDGPIPSTIDVPLISWVSAGQLAHQDAVTSFSDFPTVTAIDLPEGDYIALRVDGDSMNKISPPESIIFVNRKDRRLVSNGCYIIADETGGVTYKRYRPNETPQFQPASYEDIKPPKLEGAITVIGRVRRSIIDM